MAQTYTLDESAGKLGLPADEFKRRWKTEWTSLRTFRDGGTVRFRSADIDELARTLGMASDPGLQLGPAGSSTEYLLPSDDAVGDDIFSVTSNDSKRGKKKPADSDIRLEADSAPKSSRRRPQESVPTEELSLDLAMPDSGVKKKSGASSKKLTAPKTGTNLNKKKESDSSSEFELSLDSDSDSFELSLNPDDGSDEVDLGGSQVGKRGGSGINLARPADSGVSLESEDDFELSLDDEPSTPSGRKLSGPKSVKMPRGGAAEHSDSEFELALDDNSGLQDAIADEAAQGDIFETDFELPSEDSADLESGSEVVAVENSDTDLENSDFDLALDENDIQAEDESASQVVLLDDEAEEAPRSGRGRAAALAGGAALAGAAAARRRKGGDDEEDPSIDIDDDDAAGSLRDVPRRRVDEEDEAVGGVARAKPWGPLPAIVLMFAFILTFLGGLMSYELIRGMWNYNHGSKPGGSLVRGVADMFDMKPAD